MSYEEKSVREKLKGRGRGGKNCLKRITRYEITGSEWNVTVMSEEAFQVET